MNPFLLKGYAGSDYFCDRETDTKSVLSSLKNDQDVTIYALRRLGKSALIHHVFEQIKSIDRVGIYVDIWGTSSLQDFIEAIANAVIKSELFGKRSISKKLQTFLSGFGASINIGHDGSPSIDLMYHDKNKPFKNLEELLAFLDSTDKRVVLAIDEFQEIRKYELAVPLEANMRKLVQRHHRINFIFSGSEFHLIDDMFNNYERPFYQSTRMLALKKIPRDLYRSFILDHMNKASKNLNEEIVDYVLDITHGHTYYVQAICNLIYSQRTYPTTTQGFQKIYLNYLEEKHVFYSELPSRLTVKQFACVKAIAREGTVSSPTSVAFLEKLPSSPTPSSVQRIIKALVEKQVILKEDGSYRLYDVFLAHYLKWVKR